jgi:hypothetical protein
MATKSQCEDSNLPENKFGSVPEKIDPEEHPSRDASSRYATDQYLRRRGFRIFSRPSKGEPIWQRQDDLTGRWVFYTQSEAVLYADRYPIT